MRITTMLLVLLGAAYILQGFYRPKCEHVFTQVEQPTIKIEQACLLSDSCLPIYTLPFGLQEGKELICVKCFHIQKQVLDYGKPYSDGRYIPFIDTMLNKFRHSNCCDSIRISKGGFRFDSVVRININPQVVTAEWKPFIY